MEKKICSKCKIEKDVCEFYVDKTKIDGEGKEDKLLLFNLDIWNNAKIYNLTGYYIEMLK